MRIFEADKQEKIMPNPFFAFKKFIIHHDRCAMKVGTDGVLLGAWADIQHSRRILDVGTGTGLIAFMLAQRCEKARIIAIDIDADAVSQARENIADSPWKDRVEAILQDICSYAPEERFDTIVSNPPYFIDSLECPDNQRTLARHTTTLNTERLLEKVAELLLDDGLFSLILPTDQTDHLIRIAANKGLYLSHYTAVVTRPGLLPKRALMEFRKTEGLCKTDELIIELDRHVYSEDYIALTKDFYLRM